MYPSPRSNSHQPSAIVLYLSSHTYFFACEPEYWEQIKENSNHHCVALTDHRALKRIYVLNKNFNLMTSLCSVQFSLVAQSCPTLCDPMNLSTPGLPVHHQLPEFTQTHVHRVGDDIQPSHPVSSPSPPAPNPSQHQSLFQWVNSSHVVAKVLEFQL